MDWYENFLQGRVIRKPAEETLSEPEFSVENNVIEDASECPIDDRVNAVSLPGVAIQNNFRGYCGEGTKTVHDITTEHRKQLPITPLESGSKRDIENLTDSATETEILRGPRPLNQRCHQCFTRLFKETLRAHHCREFGLHKKLHYTCQWCDFSTAGQHGLLNHYASTHFRCPFCNNSTKNLVDGRRHIDRCMIGMRFHERKPSEKS